MSCRADRGKNVEVNDSPKRLEDRLSNGENIEVNDSPKRLEARLSNCRKPLRQPFIYRVHNYYLRDSNDNAHEPHMVAIGPYHHGKQSLKIMEEHKLHYLKSLLHRKDHKVDRYISAVLEIEEEVRSCYAEELSFSSIELVEMLVLDGCFIIELSRKSGMRDPSCASDPIFQMEWFLDLLIRDLILFENQIPFLVLCKLVELIDGGGPILINQQLLLIRSISHLLGLSPNSEMTEEVRHLLHLKHAVERPSSPIYINLKGCPDKREFQRIPSASELKDANVTFRSSSSSNPFELCFSNGVLTMSTLTIQDRTDRDMRNLILYEQYFPGNRPYITGYVMLLDCLVNTGRDVEILSQHGIIDSLTGHNQEAADIINRLGQSVIVSQTYFIYGDTFSKINDHHKRTWNKARAALSRDYFNTPWAYISFVAALLLLLLTVAQTVFSAIQL